MPSPIKAAKEDKELKGTLRKSREKEQTLEVEPVTEIPAAPEDLPEAGKEAWYRVVSKLHDTGVLSTLDFDMLKIYCFQVSVMQEAAEEMSKPKGKVAKLKSKTGESYFVKSPWVGVYNDAASQVARLAKEFGFSPLARKAIPAPVKKKESKLIALMGGKK